MAYDEQLAERVRDLLADQPGWTEQRMFGGLGFMLDGHLAFAAGGDGGLMVRCDPDDRLAESAHAGPMQMRGRAMTGWLLVSTDGLASDADLARWLAVGAARVQALHPPPRP